MSPSHPPTLLTESLLLLYITFSTLYYGYHITELNFPQPSLTCHSSSSPSSLFNLPNCLGLTEGLYSLATAAFTIGGLLGSLSSPRIIALKGSMLATIPLTSQLNILSSLLMTFSPHWSLLTLGRLLAGAAAGIGICIVPPLLSLIALSSPLPLLSSHSGSIGLLNQIAITSGIVLGGLAGIVGTGMKGDAEGGWRWVVAGGGALGVLQLVLGWAAGVTGGEVEEREGEMRRGKLLEEGEEEGDHDSGIALPGDSDDQIASAPLLPSPTTPISLTPAPTLRTLLSSPSLRPPLLLIAFILATQQFSGINATLFYSTSILQRAMGGGAGLVGVGIGCVNLLGTVPGVVLIDYLGRKPLLLTSIGLMIISCTLTGIGLNAHLTTLTAISLVCTVASFALGLGSIPFLFISELMPAPAVPATSSFALSFSWASNFIVAMGFLPLRDALSWEKPWGPGQGYEERGIREGEGNVFAVFVVALSIAWLVIYRCLYGM